MNIGEKVKERRLELGWSQDELAKRCGFKNRTSIFDIEKGRVKTPHKRIEALAKALDVSPEYLMGWVEEDEASRNDLIAEFAVKAQSSEELFNIASKLIALNDKQLALVDIFLRTLIDNPED